MFKITYALQIGDSVRVFSELLFGEKQANILANSINSAYKDKVLYTIVELANDDKGPAVC